MAYGSPYGICTRLPGDVPMVCIWTAPARAGVTVRVGIRAGLLACDNDRLPSRDILPVAYSDGRRLSLTVAGPHRIRTGFPILRRYLRSLR